MAFNISSRALNDTTILHLTDPSSGLPMYADEAEKQPLQIVVYGRSSKQYRNWLAVANRASLARKNKPQTPEQIQTETAEFLAAITKSIHNFDLDKEVLDNTESFKKLYNTPSLVWIADQVAEILGATDSFLQK